MPKLYRDIRSFQNMASGWVYTSAKTAHLTYKRAVLKGYKSIDEILSDEDFWGLLWM